MKLTEGLFRGRDHMVVGFITTYSISAYHHSICKFEFRSGVLYTTYVIKFVSDLWRVGGFLRVLRFPLPIWLPRYNWNIVESGIKHRRSRRTCSSCSRCATLLCYSCYNPSDMLLMMKGPDCDYDKLNISMVISYSVTVGQVMIATVRNFQSDDFNLTTWNSWFSSFLVSSNAISRKSW